MKKILATAGALAVLAMTSAPAQAAVSPTTPGKAWAKVYKPLAINWVQDADFGVIVLSGASPFGADTVTLSQGGVVTCGTSGNLTCTGTPKAAKYHLAGGNNAVVTISSPGFNLTGPGTLAFTPNAPATVTLDGTGVADFTIGGSISVASTTAEGVYSGTFAVTADYQ